MAKKEEGKKQSQEARSTEGLTKTEQFFDKNKKFILLGAGGVIVIILSIVMYRNFVVKPHIEESHDAYWPAFYAWQSNDSTDVAFTGNDEFIGMEEIADEYAGTTAGNIASYAMGIHKMEEGDFEGALSYLEDTDFDDVIVGTLVIGLIGDCYVEMGDFETAASKFEEAATREPNDFTTPMFYKKAGMVFEELDQMEDAVRVYQIIKDEYPESTEGQDIDKYIVRAQN